MAEWFMQAAGGVRFDWGATGAAQLGADCACLVLVDVLCFATSVCVAVERGIQVYPVPAGDESAAQLAAEVDAVLAVDRHATSKEHPWSLSPAALRQAPTPPRLVLPAASAAIAAARPDLPVVAACLRNASPVGNWLAERGYGTVDRPVAVVAAGEQWPDGTLRPALEDAIGAGAVITALAEAGPITISPEAAGVRAMYLHTGDIDVTVTTCASGRQLGESGFAADVEIAVEVDTSTMVPVLVDGAFTAADQHA